MKQLTLETTARHIKRKKIIESTQHGFTKGNSCLTNSVTLYDETTVLVYEDKIVVTVYLACSKAFDIFFHKNLIEEFL